MDRTWCQLDSDGGHEGSVEIQDDFSPFDLMVDGDAMLSDGEA